MSQLSEDHQTYIVQALACFCTPSEVVESVKEVFGVTATRQQVERYNPNRRSSEKGLAEKWRVLFKETRRQYITDAAAHGVAHQSYRLECIQDVVTRARNKGDLPLVLTALEQAAKEVGGAFTNKRKLEISPREAFAAALGLSADELPEDLTQVAELIQ